MTALFNPFTQKYAHKAFAKLTYDTPVTLNKNDSVYYAVLASKKESNQLGGNQLRGEGLDDFPNDVPDTAYAQIPKTDKTESDKEFLAEISALKGMCLAIERDDSYYINDHATILYDPIDGFFTKVGSANDFALLSSRDIGTLMILFLTFILPGKYWIAFYQIQHPTAPIYDNTALVAEMIEIEKEWININKSFSIARDT